MQTPLQDSHGAEQLMASLPPTEALRAVKRRLADTFTTHCG
jgi:hypothetical protein